MVGGTASNVDVNSEEFQSELKRKKNKMKKSIMAMIRMKQSLKRTIKDWVSDFEKANNRPPTKEEKATIHDKYMAYAMMNKHLSALEREASGIQGELDLIQGKAIGQA